MMMAEVGKTEATGGAGGQTLEQQGLAALAKFAELANVSSFEFFKSNQDRTIWQKLKWDGQDRVRTEGLSKAVNKLRQLNREGWDIYFRPAQGQESNSIISYQYLFIDDVQVERAIEIANRAPTLVIETSQEGGCQVIVFTQQLLTAAERGVLNSEAARLAAGDIGATGGIQPMRLPGSRNWKRAGQFVNVIRNPRKDLPRFDTTRLVTAKQKPITANATVLHKRIGVLDVCDLQQAVDAELASLGDDDRSRADFRACLKLLSSAVSADDLIDVLAQMSERKGRHGRHARDYSARTVAKAVSYIRQ